MSKEKIKLGIVDDHYIVRQGLKLIINSFDRCEVIMEAGDGKELIEKLEVADELPDIILVDIAMPRMNGYETVEYLRKHFKNLHCISLSVNNDFTSVFRMINSGAKAYLVKDCDTKHLYEAIIQVHKKGAYYNSFVVDSLVDYQQAQTEIDSIETLYHKLQLEQLSDNELEFIKLACSELAYKEIADKMNLSTRTIDGYREAIFSKFNIKTRVGLVLVALKYKIYVP